MKNQYLIYSLFKDVEDAQLRDSNRGNVLFNIYLDHCVEGLMPAAGVAALLGYFKDIPEAERQGALDVFGAVCQYEGHLPSLGRNH